MTTEEPTMSAREYRKRIKSLGLSQVRAGRLFGFSVRKAQRIATGDYPVPKACILALELLPILGRQRRHDLFQRFHANKKR